MAVSMSTFAGSHGLGKVRTIAEFRQFVDKQRNLSEPQRKLLVEQATILIRDLYVHLSLKRAMHAVDPVQRLRLLGEKDYEDLDEREFHAELIDIFMRLRDLHTNYTLPYPYGGRIAFLGILIEQFVEDGKTMWMVSKVAEHLVADKTLKEGALISHWNGMPMELAVWRNGDKEAGSNRAARIARGLEALTLRDLGASLPPDEDWVDLAYNVDGKTHESRLAWHVFDKRGELVDPAPDLQGLSKDLGAPLSYQVGLDKRTETLRQAKKLLFARLAVREENRVAKYEGALPRSTPALREAGVIPTNRPDDLTAKLAHTSRGTFGYLRIWTFNMKDWNIHAFTSEVIRLLEEVFPPEGLIIDVRGNGGGFIEAAEFLLQLLTPSSIEPEPAQFINTQETRALTADVPWTSQWHESLIQGVSIGEQFSRPIPLSDPEYVNSVGQVYHGPVVLITDAFCYSACDMFAAGFKDHNIGTILGVDEVTGAGGANVLEHEYLRTHWSESPLAKLPAGARMRVSLRRTLRVGARAGQPVEDLGVKRDVPAHMTRNDVLHSNRELQNKAGEILAKQKPRRFAAKVENVKDSEASLKLTTLNIPEVEISVNGRHKGLWATPDGNTKLTVKVPPGEAKVRLEGFENGALVGSRLLRIN